MAGEIRDIFVATPATLPLQNNCVYTVYNNAYPNVWPCDDVPGETEADCSYTNRLLLDAMYGRQNIDEWANLENCEDDAQSKHEIEARIQLEINRVEAYLDDSLRHLYCTPFECPVSPTIEAIATALVGHNLRDARYMNEDDTVVLRKYERAMNTLHQLKEGSIRVPGFMAKAHPQFE